MFTILRDAIILEFEGKTYTILGYKEMELLETISIVEESERSSQMKKHLGYSFSNNLQPFIDLIREPKFFISSKISEYVKEFVMTLFNSNGIEVNEYQTI